jgi:hypothetical protein
MLAFAEKYKDVIDNMCDDRKLNLQAYSLNDDEWATAAQLSKVLKVSLPYSSTFLF